MYYQVHSTKVTGHRFGRWVEVSGDLRGHGASRGPFLFGRILTYRGINNETWTEVLSQSLRKDGALGIATPLNRTERD